MFCRDDEYFCIFLYDYVLKVDLLSDVLGVWVFTVVECNGGFLLVGNGKEKVEAETM